MQSSLTDAPPLRRSGAVTCSLRQATIHYRAVSGTFPPLPAAPRLRSIFLRPVMFLCCRTILIFFFFFLLTHFDVFMECNRFKTSSSTRGSSHSRFYTKTFPIFSHRVERTPHLLNDLIQFSVSATKSHLDKKIKN